MSATSTTPEPTTTRPEYGRVWFDALAASTSSRPDLPASLRVGEATLGEETVQLIAVVPDPQARFPRARHGEVGLEEGWGLGHLVRGIVESDASSAQKTPIVVVIDVPGQAYGYVEELVGIHQSLAAATNALATARLSGHPVIAFVVGSAISGAFLSTGMQANRIVALDHRDIAVQVMSKQSTARITRRTIAELDKAAEAVPATAYDGASFAKLGAVHELVHATSPAEPTQEDLEAARGALARAIASTREGSVDLSIRLRSEGAKDQRAASILVRERVGAEWDA